MSFLLQTVNFHFLTLVVYFKKDVTKAYLTLATAGGHAAVQAAANNTLCLLTNPGWNENTLTYTNALGYTGDATYCAPTGSPTWTVQPWLSQTFYYHIDITPIYKQIKAGQYDFKVYTASKVGAVTYYSSDVGNGPRITLFSPTP